MSKIDLVPVMQSVRKVTLPKRADEMVALLHELSLPDDVSEMRYFTEVCRRSIRVRLFLFGRFANEPDTRKKFRDLLRRRISPDGLWPTVFGQWFESRPPPVPELDGPFGGLSEAEIWALLKRYQAGHINVMTFLLVRIWLQHAAANRPIPPALIPATLEHWAAIVADKTGELNRDVARAVAFFASHPSAPNPGVEDQDSWKVHLILHILDNPQPTYRVSDLLDHLPAKFRRARRNGNRFVELREIRRFCEELGIRRDQRPGRPRRPRVATRAASGGKNGRESPRR